MTITFEELKQYNKLIIAQRQLVSVTMPFTPFFLTIDGV